MKKTDAVWREDVIDAVATMPGLTGDERLMLLKRIREIPTATARLERRGDEEFYLV